MNCRKASSLLSAYIDRELTGAEMLEIRAHMESCSLCRAEHESLLQTKQLLSCLALQTPRAELEQLLVVRAVQETNPSLLARVLPPEWTDAMLFRWEGVGNLGSPRMRPLAATALLSLAGLCLATASVSRPSDEADMVPPHAVVFYASPNTSLTQASLVPTISDLNRRSSESNESNEMTASFIPGQNAEAAWGAMPSPSLFTTENRSDWNENDLILPSGTDTMAPSRPLKGRPQPTLSIIFIASQHQ